VVVVVGGCYQAFVEGGFDGGSDGADVQSWWWGNGGS